MRFSPADYGADVAAVLGMDGDGHKLIPLVFGQCSSEEARQAVPSLRIPAAAKSGLFVYLSCFEEAHNLAQSLDSAEGSLWHGILHRMEPDAGNAAYWFRRAGRHPIFEELAREAREVAGRFPQAELDFSEEWNPIEFVDLCERARRAPGSALENSSLEIQRAEWQLLFDHCARLGASTRQTR
jgi:hypothetical protein